MRRRRWVVLAGALVVLALFVGVFPTGTWLGQRDSLAAASSQLRTVDGEDQVLADQARQLQTDSEVERLARRDYGLVKSGEQAYVILPSAGSSSPRTQAVWSGGPASWTGAAAARPGLAQTERPLGQRPPTVSGQPGSGDRRPSGHGLWDRFLAGLAFWR